MSNREVGKSAIKEDKKKEEAKWEANLPWLTDRRLVVGAPRKDSSAQNKRQQGGGQDQVAHSEGYKMGKGVKDSRREHSHFGFPSEGQGNQGQRKGQKREWGKSRNAKWI